MLYHIVQRQHAQPNCALWYHNSMESSHHVEISSFFHLIAIFEKDLWSSFNTKKTSREHIAGSCWHWQMKVNQTFLIFSIMLPTKPWTDLMSGGVENRTELSS
ncbi:hypothetical protein V6N13_000624 [Hibiscus sabdariffa]